MENYLIKRNARSAAARSGCWATVSWRTVTCAKTAPPNSLPGSVTAARARWLSPWFSDRRQSTVAEIQEQLAYREANQEKVAAFRTTRTLGERTKVLLDEDAGLFMVTSARNWEEANPDVLSFSDVTGCKLDIDESKTEIEYKDKDGERKSFNPRRYAYSYDFYIVINVNNPYFSEIRFQLNSSAVDNDEETLLDGPEAMRRPRGGMRGGFGGMRGGSLTSNAEEVRASAVPSPPMRRKSAPVWNTGSMRKWAVRSGMPCFRCASRRGRRRPQPRHPKRR